MGELRRITIDVSADLLAQAQEETGRGIDDTIRAGLQRLASRRAQRELLAMRGAVDFAFDLETLRHDRE